MWERRIIGRPLSPSRQARAAGSSTVEGETPYATREAAEYPAGERHGRCGIPAAKIVGDHRRRTFFVISSNSSARIEQRTCVPFVVGSNPASTYIKWKDAYGMA